MKPRIVEDMLTKRGYQIPVPGDTTLLKLPEPVYYGVFVENVNRRRDLCGVHQNPA